MTKYLFLIFTCFFIVSCGQMSEGDAAFMEEAETSFRDQSMGESTSLSMAKKTSLDLEAADKNQSDSQESKPSTPPKKLIRTANIRMELDHYEEGRIAINKQIAQYEAVIANESEQRSTYRIENRLVIRIAPEKFDAFVTVLDKIALNTVSKSINTRDVSRQYVDIETRLASKRAIVKRYREILQSARSISDVLAVEENLRKVVEEIESTEGQLRYLKDQVRFSTITLEIFQDFDRPAIAKRGFFSRIGNALGDGWNILQGLVVGLFTIWPIVLIISLLVFFGLRWRRRRKVRVK